MLLNRIPLILINLNPEQRNALEITTGHREENRSQYSQQPKGEPQSALDALAHKYSKDSKFTVDIFLCIRCPDAQVIDAGSAFRKWPSATKNAVCCAWKALPQDPGRK